MSYWICLPSIKSYVTDNKNKIWKYVRLTCFQNPQFSIRSSPLQVCPSVFFLSVSRLIYTFLPSFESLFLCFTKFDGRSHGLNFYMKDDHRNYRRNFGVAKRKPEKVQACTGFEPLTSAIPMQRSIPIELRSQLGAGRWIATQQQKFHTDDVKSIRNPFKNADWSTELLHCFSYCLRMIDK